MLTSFFVKNFRLFTGLEIRTLGRVNLIVGRNGSGKSALLEAVGLYSNNADGSFVRDLILARQETWGGQFQINGHSAASPIRHLFHNHELPKLGEGGIILGSPRTGSHQLGISIAAYSTEADESGLPRVIPIAPKDLADNPEIRLALVAQEGDKTRRILWLDRDLTKPAPRTIASPTLSPRFPTYIVPTRNMTDESLASAWDQITLTGLEQEAVSGLQLIDQTIEGVAFVEAPDRRVRSQRIPLVKTRRHTEPLPLNSLGDGMVRLLHIIVALVGARNGILLVDEFENGLHWSVQPGIWRTVFRLADKLGVQVFATTHSRDCIVGFHAAWKEQEQLGGFLRLNNRNDDPVTATLYNYETLSDSLETEVEMR